MLEKRMLHPFRMLKDFLQGTSKQRMSGVVWSTEMRSWVTDGGLQGFKKKKKEKQRTQDQLKPFSNSLMFSLFPRECQLLFD